jgi:2-methylcitrate dehydratase
MSSRIPESRPDPDQLLVDIANYVLDFKIESSAAFNTARYCLIDALGCGLEALAYPACSKLLGPVVPGTVVPHGARVPGTPFQLDPIQAAFNIGTLIRWLDFNDTWLAAEWGHPSDNLGGILATADWLSRTRLASGQAPLQMRQVLEAMIKAYEIQGVLALENSFNRVGLDHVLLVKVATAAVCTWLMGGGRAADHQRRLAGFRRWPAAAHLSARAEHRFAQVLGRRRCDRARGHAGLVFAQGRNGLSERADGQDLGFPGRAVQGAGFARCTPVRQLRDRKRALQDQFSGRVSRPDGGRVRGGAASAGAGSGRRRSTRVVIRTHESALRIIDKQGPLHNPADRDHCLQYMVAYALINGELSADAYEDEAAADPRIDALRAKIEVVEDLRFLGGLPESREAFDRQRATGLFRRRQPTEELLCEYPLGHRRRRAEGIPVLLEKFRKHLARRFTPSSRLSSSNRRSTYAAWGRWR